MDVNISRTKLRRLEKEASIGRKFLSAKKRRQNNSTKLGRLLHGIDIAHATKIGVNTLEKIVTLSTMAFFANLDFWKVIWNASPKCVLLSRH